MSFFSTLVSRLAIFFLIFFILFDDDDYSVAASPTLVWTSSTSGGSSTSPTRRSSSTGTTISGDYNILLVLAVFILDNFIISVTFKVKLCRSYTALADVLSLFVVLPLMVRTLGFHDMTIVICAVSAHVRLMLDLIGDEGVTDMGP